jgi:hypothetical protein
VRSRPRPAETVEVARFALRRWRSISASRAVACRPQRRRGLAELIELAPRRRPGGIRWREAGELGVDGAMSGPRGARRDGARVAPADARTRRPLPRGGDGRAFRTGRISARPRCPPASGLVIARPPWRSGGW